MVRVAGGWYIPAFHFFFGGGPSFTFFVNLPNCLYMIERDLTEMKRTGFWSEEIFIVFLHNPTSSSLGAPFFFKKKNRELHMRQRGRETYADVVCQIQVDIT
ncbi:hypothetical protein, unlikely [Trypanosoma brucei gambiense DAL972]|uniref:Uncharacterized protein n=1 Tax=Trypanosoma brucei gambiense (strain MHOM/CI/86/DAL972) TaxID=679716 RepID=C9ZTG4_TRYB9|nr:hypothetical protein, unlikely [Trypanosoma brucei gambiense DAL972]CBH12699.1 hypothetical protein, unlikely [Trypanosoma brucei gambiense DAL972]|eukprot:XP_011774979.1 hypothetical protein, unlikely [Trypanosoma brucei gambiense DAL972]